MSIELIHLRKLMQLMYAGQRQQTTLLRAEIRLDQARAQGIQQAGGDFYSPFWADVKDHVSGSVDLADSSRFRIEKNSARERLYPILRDGFLSWWNEHRRWTNEPFYAVRAPSASIKVSDLLTIKLDNFLAVRDAGGIDRYIYPYFYESPVLRNEAARISLWAFKQAFPALQFKHFRILDVPRGRIFSPDRCYLEGDERELLIRKHEDLWKRYVEIEELLG